MYDAVPERIRCPYCGEPIEVLGDTSVDQQAYIEDCSVCCRPMSLFVSISGDEITIEARDENDVAW